jgi:endonuclease/exonuclease/phosphatase (EEP) superfamily protein YafD
VSIKYNSKNIDFALIHTSAPVSQHFFNMRNQQLSDLSNLMTKYYNTKKDQNIILVGDFNLTPRSHYYKSFATSMKLL